MDSKKPKLVSSSTVLLENVAACIQIDVTMPGTAVWVATRSSDFNLFKPPNGTSFALNPA